MPLGRCAEFSLGPTCRAGAVPPPPGIDCREPTVPARCRVPNPSCVLECVLFLMDQSTAKRYLPWVVAIALFMQQLDSTVVNTAIPAMAHSLNTTLLTLKSVVTSYLLSLVVCIPIIGWLTERYGSRRVFLIALAMLVLSSVACGLAVNVHMLIAARIPQGVSAAMMMPVGRMAIVRTFPKAELLRAMNFVIIPALIGPLLGPTVGGLIVDLLTWRDIFFVNVPVGLMALSLGHRFMPDYRSEMRQSLGLRGLLLSVPDCCRGCWRSSVNTICRCCMRWGCCSCPWPCCWHMHGMLCARRTHCCN